MTEGCLSLPTQPGECPGFVVRSPKYDYAFPWHHVLAAKLQRNGLREAETLTVRTSSALIIINGTGLGRVLLLFRDQGLTGLGRGESTDLGMRIDNISVIEDD
jgi:hypothetical protein